MHIFFRERFCATRCIMLLHKSYDENAAYTFEFYWKEWKDISMRKFSFRSRELPRFGPARIYGLPPELLSQNNLPRGFTIAKKLIELRVVLYLCFITTDSLRKAIKLTFTMTTILHKS